MRVLPPRGRWQIAMGRAEAASRHRRQIAIPVAATLLPAVAPAPVQSNTFGGPRLGVRTPDRILAVDPHPAGAALRSTRPEAVQDVRIPLQLRRSGEPRVQAGPSRLLAPRALSWATKTTKPLNSQSPTARARAPARLSHHSPSPEVAYQLDSRGVPVGEAMASSGDFPAPGGSSSSTVQSKTPSRSKPCSSKQSPRRFLKKV